jgi:hypothetical protein
VDHVDIDHRVGALDRPGVRLGGVEPQRRHEVRQARVVAPGGDAGQGVGIGIGGLPGQMGQGGGVVGRVLAGA